MDCYPDDHTGMGLASLGIFGVQAAWGVDFSVSLIVIPKWHLQKSSVPSVWRDCTTYRLCATLVLRALWPIAIYFAFMAAIGLVTTFLHQRLADGISTYPRMQFKARDVRCAFFTKDFWVITPYAVWKNHSERNQVGAS